ncbi:threonine synthase-like 1 isoform X2 [Lingula anatina]|nr:threonine synthase-like 1 isoform X2 [Lingula anatina]XP_013410221.1 threonine synthase-like 1 isoform X2 [Lingula anatina]XP_023932703.1 threonine synthase-like 1 isoform X2 [Lingula anatina]|eukprot:XP_013410220.1 threonine synthase-like 1 isoform X2 [Lingula anatina]
MGSPGSGKTTVGRLLGDRLGKRVIDVDNDHLESYWNMSVADKLQQVGGDQFLQDEGEALLNLRAEDSIISLSGSNPMHPAAMEHIQRTGMVIFLDVQHDNIVDRLERMKVNRIVGQGRGVPMIDILKYRQQFYEGNYDLRILCEDGETQESIADKIVKSLGEFKSPPHRYTSTRSNLGKGSAENHKSFCDVVLEGLAPDKGLYIRNGAFPKFTPGELQRLLPLSYQERALRILEKWIHPDDLHPRLLGNMINNAYSLSSFNCHKVFPLVHLRGNQYLMELFHGPTASFKDAALQLMPQFFQHSLDTKEDSNTRYLILVATSGDTGGAVLDGFAKHAGPRVGVMVLYPNQGISPIQKLQMTSMTGDRVSVVGVESDFDFCQSTVKKIISNPDMADKLLESFGCKLSAANSINWGRLLPQTVYHITAYLDLVQTSGIKMGEMVDLCIPTGNFGNILTAFYAREMGVPIHRLILASNVNNILTEFFTTGRYNLRNQHLRQTISPAIDILKSSNLERFLYHMTDGDFDQIKEWYSQLDKDGHFTVPTELVNKMQDIIKVDWCSEEDCKSAMRDTFQETGYLLDPHTAVGKVIADRFNQGDRPVVIASTAHYGKFAQDVYSAINKDDGRLDLNPAELFEELGARHPRPAMHWTLGNVVEKAPVHRTVCGADVREIEQELEKFVEKCWR